MGRRVKIQEYSGGNLTSTKQLIWSFATKPREERDASGNVAKQFFAKGQTIGGTSYFYTRDQLGSIREMTDSSGNVQAQYQYDSYGQKTKLQGSLDADLQFATYYFHGTSGLSLTMTRAYNTNLGRFINRDPIEEAGGINLFAYVGNNPISMVDTPGTQSVSTSYPASLTTMTGEPSQYASGYWPAYDFTGQPHQWQPSPVVTVPDNSKLGPGLVLILPFLMPELPSWVTKLNTKWITKFFTKSKPCKTWKLGQHKSVTTWENQMKNRGWTPEQITEAIEKGQKVPAPNLVNPNNPATRYINPTTGQSVVVDDVTGDVIHIGGPDFQY